jgi:pre-mRNA-splicing factor ATP-dependent RNA helicase DHX16
MASEKELRSWVSDQLHSLIGYSDKTVADFILASAKKAKDAHSLVKNLASFGIPSGPAGSAFAEDLLSRLPRSSGRAITQQQLHRQQALQLVKKSKAYGLLDDEDQEPEAVKAVKAAKPSKGSKGATAADAEGGSSKSSKHRQHRRTTAASDDDTAAADAAAAAPLHHQQQRRKRKWEEDEEDEQSGRGVSDKDAAAAEAARQEAQREAQREADQLEKEEFERR